MDETLLEYATERQAESLRAYWEHGSYQTAADALGISKRAVWQSVKAVRAKAAQHGYAPDHDLIHQTPPGFKLNGTSTLYDEGGNKRLEWVKTSEDREAIMRLLEQAVESLSQEVKPAKPVKAPKGTEADLCNKFIITDYHVGALSWARETGADWDLDIAEQTLDNCFSRLLAGAPRAGTAIVGQLGDFLHTDGLIPQTPTANNILDADGRFEKIAEVAVRSLRRVVDLALAQHEHVHVIMAEGNHDIASSVWLRVLFAALYEKEPRVTVDRSPLPYYAFQHGKTMIGLHHGHLKKIDSLAGVFAAQFPEMWGSTKYRYGDVGHLHHKHVIAEREDAGMTMERHRTLSARDAYAARGGYFAERKIKCTTYHRDFGEVAANYVTPEMAL